MKKVILSADAELYVYSVPNVVADNLEDYCQEFQCDWLVNSKEAKKYRRRGGLIFNEKDFIEYLNTYIFPDDRSVLVEKIGFVNIHSGEVLPKKYENIPRFNF